MATMGETRRVRRRPTKQQTQVWEQLELTLMQSAFVRLDARWIVRLTTLSEPPLVTIRQLAEQIDAYASRWQQETTRLYRYPWRREEVTT